MKKEFSLTALIISISLLLSCNKENTQDIRDSYSGSYLVTETWTDNGKTISKPAFTITVDKSSQHADMILLNNFSDYGYGVAAEATVAGNSMSILQQTLPNLKEIAGAGTVSDTTLIFSYTETYNSISINVSAVAKKR